MLGPRQAGKTTLATMLAGEERDHTLYLDLELPSDRAKLSDPELYLSRYEDRLVILDEIHRVPGIFQVLRGLIDVRRRRGIKAGQFLVLGSASMDLLRQSPRLWLDASPVWSLRPSPSQKQFIMALQLETACGYGAGSRKAFLPAMMPPGRVAASIHSDLPRAGHTDVGAPHSG